MKTTNYKISKQLLEAGFKKKTNWVWSWSGDDHQLLCYNDTSDKVEEKDFLSYDFETILETLPRNIELRKKGKIGVIYELRAYFHSAYQEIECVREESNYIGYQNFQGFHPVLTVMQQENESLADATARLWLELKEMGFV